MAAAGHSPGPCACLFDRLGPWFTLLAIGTPPSGALVAAARDRGVPIAVLETASPAALAVHGRGLLLVRPDQHIAWRGIACEDAQLARRVIARVLGWEDET